ncbi:mitochondrial import inner membrane translocase subunit tim21 [Sorochytrium milnesiophthora]
MGILVAGVVVFGTLAYYIGTELLGTTSPSAVYARTVDILRQHPAVVAIFDSDFNCHTDPEQGHRRRSRQISHRIVENLDGERRMIMQFYIDNSQRQAQGVVHVEMVQSADGGEWRYAALSVDARHVSGHSKRIVIVN